MRVTHAPVERGTTPGYSCRTLRAAASRHRRIRGAPDWNATVEKPEFRISQVGSCSSFFEKCLKRVQVDRLELAKSLHPDGRVMHCAGLQPAPLYPASPFLRYEPGPGQDGQMLADRRERNPERFGYIRNRHIVFQKHLENLTPGWIGQRREHGIK